VDEVVVVVDAGASAERSAISPATTIVVTDTTMTTAAIATTFLRAI